MWSVPLNKKQDLYIITSKQLRLPAIRWDAGHFCKTNPVESLAQSQVSGSLTVDCADWRKILQEMMGQEPQGAAESQITAQNYGKRPVIDLVLFSDLWY